MFTSEQSLFAAASGLASVEIAAALAMAPAPDADPISAPSAAIGQVVAELIRSSAAANDALMRGDIARYRSLVAMTDDFTLMSPFGGTPSHMRGLTADRIEAMGRFFRNGSLRQDVVHAYGSADMVVLAVIERAHVEVGGLPPQDWALRVTLVYRRDGDGWRLAHRHADPLATGISLEHSAALARGER